MPHTTPSRAETISSVDAVPIHNDSVPNDSASSSTSTRVKEQPSGSLECPIEIDGGNNGSVHSMHSEQGKKYQKFVTTPVQNSQIVKDEPTLDTFDSDKDNVEDNENEFYLVKNEF